MEYVRSHSSSFLTDYKMSGEMVFLMDRSGVFLRPLNRVDEIFPEMDNSLDLPASIYEMLPGDSHEKIKSTINTLQGVREQIESSFEISDQSGESRGFRLLLSLISDNQISGILIEETAAHHLREALQNQAKSFKHIMRLSNDAVFIHKDGYLLEWNPSLTKVSGFNDEELKDMQFRDLLDAGSRDAIDLRIKRSAEGTGETLGIRKDGTRYNIEFKEKRIIYYDQQVSLVVLKDVSARRRHEAKLKYVVDLQNIVYLISSNFINIPLKDIQDELVHALRKVAIYMGMDKGAVLVYNSDHSNVNTIAEWTSDYSQIGEDDFEQHLISGQYPKALSELIHKGVFAVPSVKKLPLTYLAEKQLLEQYNKRASIVVPLEVESALTGLLSFSSTIQENDWNSETIGLLKLLAQSISNVMQRKRMASEIHDREERYKLLYENNPSMYFTLDDNGVVINVNNYGAKHLGYTQEELLGNPVSMVFHPEDIKGVQKQLASCQITDDDPMPIKARKIHKNGEIMWVEERVVKTLDEKGRPIYLVVCNDVTGNKEMEKIIEDKDETLTDISGDMHRFLQAASHDLKQPLRMISSYVQLLERRHSKQFDEEANEYVRHALDGVRQMDELVNNLQEYMVLGNPESSAAPVSFRTLAEKCENRIRRRYPNRKINITCAVMPEVKGSAEQLEIMLMHLFDNAVKFTIDEDVHISIDVKNNQTHWQFDIADKGIGIDQIYADRIFIMFERLNDRSRYPGSGMGLAICKKIAAIHKGKIWLDTSYTEGACISFTIAK